jgi:hypothetical protein
MGLAQQFVRTPLVAHLDEVGKQIRELPNDGFSPARQAAEWLILQKEWIELRRKLSYRELDSPTLA